MSETPENQIVAPVEDKKDLQNIFQVGKFYQIVYETAYSMKNNWNAKKNR